MLMQPRLPLSPYLELYELIVPKDHKLRKFKDLVDFSFVYEELKRNYCLDNGRGAIDPIRMFKYLFLKSLYDLSDVDPVERSRTDLAFKYFLDMTPEETVIDPSSLTKFRKQRLKDMALLDLLITKTIRIALEKGVVKSKTLIVDSTHTMARYNLLSPHDALFGRANRLRKLICSAHDIKAEELPTRPQADSGVAEVLSYSQKLAALVKSRARLSQYPAVAEHVHVLEETIADTLENRCISSDPEARVGHKSADSSFYGYKTHLAMTEDRLITAAVVTTGERTDGKQLKDLVEKSEKAGIEVKEVIGDVAYSDQENQRYLGSRKIVLLSRERRNVIEGRRDPKAAFDFNKDAGMYVCPAGHMSIRKAASSRKSEQKSPRISYYFDTDKCKFCKQRDGCYKEGARLKTYSVLKKSPVLDDRIAFQRTEYFIERVRQRYKIEAKNSELKNAHGYHTAWSVGVNSLKLQGAMAIFVVNLKRILTLIENR